MDLKFEYCECGCKRYTASVGDKSYWIFWDAKNQYRLETGSRSLIGTYDSYESAVSAATTDAQLKKL